MVIRAPWLELNSICPSNKTFIRNFEDGSLMAVEEESFVRIVKYYYYWLSGWGPIRSNKLMMTISLYKIVRICFYLKASKDQVSKVGHPKRFQTFKSRKNIIKYFSLRIGVGLWEKFEIIYLTLAPASGSVIRLHHFSFACKTIAFA